MKLEDYYIVPGTVIDVADPKYIGRVKADSPGLFDSSVMNKEGMPWIFPLSMSGYQRFSKLRNGSKIWIMTDKDHHEFWYWPMFELNTDTRGIISGDESDYDESEVLLSRNNGDNGIYIYYSPSKGIMIQNTDNTLINLKPDNEVEIKAGKGNVVIKDNIVHTGSTDNLNNYTQAVLGDKLKSLVSNLKLYLQTLQTTLEGYPYTSAVGSAAKPFFEMLKQDESWITPDKLLSNNVKLD